MLNHLHIKNYRLFKFLQLDRLKRVNLITGKNNTGKTAILEALRISEEENFRTLQKTINNILQTREDTKQYSTRALGLNISRFDYFDILITLFSNKNYQKPIDINQTVIGYNEDRKGADVFSIQKMNGKSKGENSATNALPKKQIVLSNTPNYYINSDSVVYIPASFDYDYDILWQNFQLSSKRKKLVIDILKIIEPRITDVDLSILSKKPIVLLAGEEESKSLKNFGEGMNRLFAIALALVTATEKILLIDEIDLGLHHSVQEKLWEIIFKFSKDLDVQVFATTHSQDCVAAFAEVWNRTEHQSEGQYIRLQRSRLDETIVEPIYYTAELLLGSIYDNLETR